MKKIGIFVNTDKDKDLEVTSLLYRKIIEHKMQVFMLSEIESKIGVCVTNIAENDIFENSDIIICVGGDGTFLNVAKKSYTFKKPIIGINLGTLGFLTEIDRHDIESAILHIKADNYEVEERMMLEAVVYREGKELLRDYALNDIVISRGALSRIINLNMFINDGFVDTYTGDGLIIATPTGSTAYTLSAGGPIVEPGNDLIIVTPICPHTLYSRSVVTTADRAVKIQVSENYHHNAMITADGQTGNEIRGGDVLVVSGAKEGIKIIHIVKRSFFDVLRQKIYNRKEIL